MGATFSPRPGHGGRAARRRTTGGLRPRTPAIALPVIAALPRIYVTGHRNPDTDSIASAVGYAELMGRVDPHNEYVPVRLGEINTQTRWVLERAGASEPEFLPHVMLRVSRRHARALPAGRGRRAGPRGRPADGARGPRPRADRRRRRRARRRDDRARARPPLHPRVARAVRARRADHASARSSRCCRASWSAATRTPRSPARSGAWRWTSASLPSEIGPGDVAVVGNRDDAQRAAIELGVGLLVTSNGTTPTEATLALAAERGVPVVRSPLDSYVTARMITLSAPCRALMDPEPLTVRPDDLLSDVADEVKEVHYRAAVAVDARRHPIGLVTRTDLVNPRPRRVLLVDHAEQAQSVPGVEQAEIVEILDHHHIGSIETTVPGAGDVRPGRLDLDAGDRALPPERDGAEPLDGDAAAVRDPVGHGDPQLADDDRARPRAPSSTSQRVLALDAIGARARDVRGDLRPRRRRRRRDRHARRQGVRGRRRADDRDRPGRDGRPGARRTAATSCWTAMDARRASAAATRSTR